ncbi:MAG: hypothetical protein WCK34_18805, partial [Bacteroidota bacterium]
PLFFMLFYNHYFSPKLNLLFSLQRNTYKKAKPKAKPEILADITGKEQLFDKLLGLAAGCMCLFTLVFAFYLTLVRYFNVL